MGDSGPGWPVIFASLPVPRKPAANSNQTLKMIRMGEGETVVKRARLREAKQKYSLRIRRAFGNQCLREVQQGLMMNSNRFLRMKVCEPAKAETQRPTCFFRLLQVLMKPLK